MMRGGRASIYILTFDMSCINSSSSSALLWLLFNIPHALWSSSLRPIRAEKLTKTTLAWWLDLLIPQPSMSLSMLLSMWFIRFVLIFKLGPASISFFENVFSCLLDLLNCSKSVLNIIYTNGSPRGTQDYLKLWGRGWEACCDSRCYRCYSVQPHTNYITCPSRHLPSLSFRFFIVIQIFS